MLEFAWPHALLALPLPLLAWLLPRASTSASAVALRVPFMAAVGGLSKPSARRPSRIAIALLIWLLLVAAASRPQFLGEPLVLPINGRDLLLAVDISGSMREQDLLLGQTPSTRLRVVQAVASDFIERRLGDRLGLILFGSRAYLQTPLTFDRKTVQALLAEAEIGLAGKQTAIGDAIGLAVKRLRPLAQESRVLILLTDGANSAGAVEPLRAAELARQEGLRIYTIGVGADEMLVRGIFGTNRVNPSAELDEDTLRQIAAMTGGRYFRARATTELEAIYSLLDELEPVASDQETLRPIEELYYWPLALALGLSLLPVIIATRFKLKPRLASAHG